MTGLRWFEFCCGKVAQEKLWLFRVFFFGNYLVLTPFGDCTNPPPSQKHIFHWEGITYSLRKAAPLTHEQPFTANPQPPPGKAPASCIRPTTCINPLGSKTHREAPTRRKAPPHSYKIGEWVFLLSVLNSAEVLLLELRCPFSLRARPS